MSSTLSEGVRVPDIGSVNWGADVNYNWGLLNTALANISGNVKTDVENTWTAPQTFTETISGSIDGVAARAVGDEDGNNIKTALAGKQPSLSQSQLDACNSGVTASAVQQISTNASNISGLQTAVAGKAADADVVHLAGTETITGDKTHDANLGITGNHLFAWDRPQVTMGTNPTSGVYFGTQRFRDSNEDSFMLVRGAINAYGNTSYIVTLYPWSAPTEGRGFEINTTADGVTSYFRPIGAVHLGSTSSKWQSLNGINPGALSLPAVATTWLDTTGWVLDGTTENNLPISGSTVTLGYGWLQFRVSHTLGTSSFIRVDTSYRIWTAQDENCLPTYTLWMPVFVNASFRVIIKADSVQVRFHPCLGNV